MIANAKAGTRERRAACKDASNYARVSVHEEWALICLILFLFFLGANAIAFWVL